MVNYATAAVDKASVMRGLVSTKRVPLGSEIYNRILETLYDEAAALDERRFDDWVAYLETDLVYTAPLRLTRNGPNKDRDVVRTMKHFDETYGSMLMRTGRLAKSAWAEDPPSRTRRFVTNVRVGESETAGEYEVVSYLYLERSRMDNPENERLSAERRDIWRLVDGAYKLARREIILDQSTLGMSNLAVFL
ncbi:MAG: aromatic-ring-hydroxylating dioxygenase subunit beta [Novosphingobium sp.]|mgnify:FL=1|jgi:3-phenylpropionate/cinnamic acid dioxygenase small subunit|uniref:3-phenylpropionate/cinnamic acid dioxygenase subunit beta n=1 Tax=Novosphingobium indicum TaxID=462949 RepID=A0ABQ2JRS2_9SPHN|nr:3-phenylpropionate/cinnamic acid dioxygenase subunit beta [Novosphingobium indicum]MAC58790.1 aromatic-ring-hydroxylating dioxygenase subunit beta [Novosphingobium sp.]GGN52020.1 3-phenylpropionate/cinnamic acid dioxygenase subunit beta [Novosphingobium indicum]|tara:strand:+ start:76 stop:651 length:576 start_codon:yes stop_codon:yes gene_type:complete